MTIVIVEISIPMIRTAVLNDWLIFGKTKLFESVHLLEEGGRGRKAFWQKSILNSTCHSKGLIYRLGTVINMCRCRTLEKTQLQKFSGIPRVCVLENSRHCQVEPPLFYETINSDLSSKILMCMLFKAASLNEAHIIHT